MKKEIEITVPKDFSAVTLKQYLKIQDDLKNYEDDKEAQDAFLLFNLCKLTPELTNKLDKNTLDSIKNDLNTLLNNQEYPLQKIVKIDEKEYGFEPNLSNLAYGAYLDISKFETLSIDKNWSTIMAILYREVTNKKGALYEIAGYKGVEPWDEDRWMDVTMDIHFGCFFFFKTIYLDLLNDILNSSKEQVLKGETQHPYIQRIFQESGKVINQWQSLHKKTYSIFPTSYKDR
jgi:hypothetical protein